MREKLKKYMEDNNLNQKQLASLMGITESHLSRLLSGDKKAGEKTVEAYFNLPGIKEKEIINKVREQITVAWTCGSITDNVAEIFLETLNPQD